jgi:hypothetical protein
LSFTLVSSKKYPFHPGSRRRLAGFRAEFFDDAVDGHELDHVGIADQDLVEQDVAGGMIVAVDEPGHDGHLLGVERLGPFADQRLDVRGAPHGEESAALHRERP